MLRKLMHYLRDTEISKNGYAQNGCGPRDRHEEKVEAEFTRRMADEARRYENDLRKLAKT
jgi:hypothetical protein